MLEVEYRKDPLEERIMTKQTEALAKKGRGMKGVVVIAQDPVQMQEAQGQMVAWATHKIQECQVELADLQENLDVAKKNKWRTSTLKRACTKMTKRVQFYTKAKAALEAGYHMIPDFPVGVFAIRTCKEEPTDHDLHNWANGVMDNETESPPLGEGEYVSADPKVTTVEGPDKKGETKTFFTADEELQPVRFPFTFAKAEIMKATSRAMALRVFDEIGCLPEPRRHGRPGAGDPIIVGIVKTKEGYNEKRLAFLITWFMDLDSL
jgi:hypothetical protein